MDKLILKSNLSRNKHKRVGRGISAGQGKTSGRGTKGEKSRTGFNIPLRFEGGQTPLSMRLPKSRGFSQSKGKTTILTLTQISQNFKALEEVSCASLLKKKLIQNEKVKILNNGVLEKKLYLVDVPASKSAQKKFSKKAAKNE